MHLKSLLDWTEEDVSAVLEKGLEIKASPEETSRAFAGRTLILLFEKTSTRTRSSFEAGVTRMGGHAMVLDVRTTQLAKGAVLKDEVQCLGRYGDAIASRVYKHETLEIMAQYAGVPVINALCDRYHPCQALADLMTLREKLGSLSGRKLCYVGDGNNVCNSLIIAAARVGLGIAVATPKGYEPRADAVAEGERTGVLTLTTDPKEAAAGADAVYTDTWVSMGQEEESAERLKDFASFQVTRDLLGDALFMHCLPLYRGQEVAEDVPELETSIIFDQAENRMHIQNAVLLRCLNL
ncbi:MAG: ornithine carbamoyltransferase [Planctomycetota bacterium]|jgi:ornithine carbamoyltransferase